MKKIIITYGLIAGAIVSAMLVIYIPFVENGTIIHDYGMLVGYTTMVIALSMVFVGTKRYRDVHNGGIITFGQAFKVGILISVIAALMYAVTWEIYYNTVGGNFMEQYVVHQMDKLKAQGASAAELLKAKQEMDKMNEYYKNPIIRFAMTLMEILPVGLLITLLSAVLLKRKEVTPANI